MLVKKAKVVLIRVRRPRILSPAPGGSEYQKTQSVCGIPLLTPGLGQCDKLPQPGIFTPATKGRERPRHQRTVSFDEAARRIGQAIAATLPRSDVILYTQAADYAASHGVIIADTKFEVRNLRRSPDPDRRSPDPRQQPVLAGRSICSPGRRSTQLRQAAFRCRELAGKPAVEQGPASARPSA